MDKEQFSNLKEGTKVKYSWFDGGICEKKWSVGVFLGKNIFEKKGYNCVSNVFGVVSDGISFEIVYYTDIELLVIPKKAFFLLSKEVQGYEQ